MFISKHQFRRVMEAVPTSVSGLSGFAARVALMNLILIFALHGCGGDDASGPTLSSVNLSTTTTTTTTGSGTGAVTVSLSASANTIDVGDTVSLQANVTDTFGSAVANGTVVTFAVSSASMGSVTPSATTTSGLASATFVASTVPGTVTLSASVGGTSASMPIIIASTENSAIEYVSATTQALGVKGSGRVEKSTVVFLVRDDNSNSVGAGEVVSFVLAGPSGGRQPSAGGEYIGSDDGTPTTATGLTDANGLASVVLTAGKVAGSVTLTATVATSTGGAVSASTPTISIGGGTVSASHFNIAADTLNLAGLAYSGLTTDIQAYVADRFGNFNILEGTTVSFYTEAGAIGANSATDDTGLTSVTFRTQAPIPNDVSLNSAETTLINSLNATYTFSGSLSPIPTDGSVHPRDGHVRLLATVSGEETFTDANANGIYDSGETFSDIGEPYVDANDSAAWNTGEFYVDSNGNGLYDGPNAKWDGPGCSDSGCEAAKIISTSLNLAFTGNLDYCAIAPTTFAITNGSSANFTFVVGDVNLNGPTAGSQISVTASTGEVSGTSSYTVPEMVGGPVIINFRVSDADATTTAAPPEVSTITVSVTSDSGVAICADSVVSGTVE